MDNIWIPSFDSLGLQGVAFHYSMILLFVGCATTIFVFLWWRGGLDMDEEPKQKMMEKEDG